MGLSFTTDWLRLREPFDHAARAPAPTEAARAWLAGHARPLVVDLGCGRGSNLRFLAPRVPADARWRLVDQDAGLLAEAATALGGAPVETRLADLRTADLGDVLEGADLVAAAALIDLVAAPWLDALIAAAAKTASALLVTGSVDGRVAWHPVIADDAAVLEAYARHQRGDKGFGAALGTRAPEALNAALRRHGWQVVAAPGDWNAVADAAFQRAYLEGVVDALRGTDRAPVQVDRWARARRAAIDAGESRLTVGHLDLFAAPPRAGRTADDESAMAI